MIRLLLLLAFFALASCVSVPDTDLSTAKGGAYRLDPDHASLIWRVGHAKGLSRFTGRFDGLQASLDFNPQDPAHSALDVRITAASVNTGVGAAFDEKIANTVFDAKTHPQIHFQSTGITVTENQTGTVTGALSFRGISRPVTLNVHFNGSAFDPLRGAQVLGFSAHGRFNRSDFGANAWSAFGVGDEVEIEIEAEFLKN